MSFKFILSDLDGVIRKFPIERDAEIEQKYNLPSGSLYRAAFDNSYLDKAVRGYITDEEWRQTILDKLNQVSDATIAKKAFQEWNDFSGAVDYEYLNYLDSKFSNVPIAVLTNGTTRLRSDLAKLDINNWFFKIFNSADVGLCKPEKTIFEYVLGKLACAPSDILFIDDSESNVRVAKELGFNTHHYKSLETFKEEFQIEACNEFT